MMQRWVRRERRERGQTGESEERRERWGMALVRERLLPPSSPWLACARQRQTLIFLPLTAQVYLFIILFSLILFSTPIFIKICEPRAPKNHLHVLSSPVHLFSAVQLSAQLR
jgi:hypothetical protein